MHSEAILSHSFERHTPHGLGHTILRFAPRFFCALAGRRTGSMGSGYVGSCIGFLWKAYLPGQTRRTPLQACSGLCFHSPRTPYLLWDRHSLHLQWRFLRNLIANERSRNITTSRKPWIKFYGYGIICSVRTNQRTSCDIGPLWCKLGTARPHSRQHTYAEYDCKKCHGGRPCCKRLWLQIESGIIVLVVPK